MGFKLGGNDDRFSLGGAEGTLKNFLPKIERELYAGAECRGGLETRGCAIAGLRAGIYWHGLGIGHRGWV